MEDDTSKFFLHTRLPFNYGQNHKIVSKNYDVFFHSTLDSRINQRGLNRWSNNSEQKLGFLSKVKILKDAFNKK